MENNSGLIPAKKDGVLVYIGDTEFFNKKVAGGFIGAPDAITRAISEATEGVIISKGPEAFKEGFIREFEVGEKVSYKGYHGQIYPRKSGSYKIMGSEEPNKAYYRILKDSDIEALCINENQ